MSRFKRYERYKDSGVEWIGEIPEEWDVLKLKWIFKLVYRYPTYYGIQYSDNGVIEVRGEMLKGNGLIDVESCEPRFISEEISNNYPMTKLKKDDIVMSVRGTMGKIGLVTNNIENANITANLLRLSPNKNKVYSKWLVWLMESSRFNEELDNYSDQTTIKTIRVPNLLSINIPLPKYDEQNAIANFLYQKTAEIDGLIADKEKLIELLQEKRQAIITEAVTKGLNPNVRMKDSGIEWIGEIPEHWEVKKLKYVSNITMGQSPKSEECSYDEIGVPFLQGNAEFTNVHPIPKLYCNTANKFSKVNDILLSVRAPVGAMNISDRVYGIGRELCAITAKKIQVKYLWYSLTVSLEELFIKSKGSTFEAVTVTDVQNLLIILPPKNEQDAIVNFLDQKTAEIDSLVTETKNQIEKLKEYRQSLISEAVTGKIDVREFQNKNEVIFRNE
jgi:type I restriction enzyme S subunit